MTEYTRFFYGSHASLYGTLKSKKKTEKCILKIQII